MKFWVASAPWGWQCHSKLPVPVLREQDAPPERHRRAEDGSSICTCSKPSSCFIFRWGAIFNGISSLIRVVKMQLHKQLHQCKQCGRKLEDLGTGESLGAASQRSHSTMRASSNNTRALKLFRRVEDSLSHLGVQKWCYPFPSGFSLVFRQEPFLCLGSVKD